SSTQEGQIYIPEVNWAIGTACVVLVLTFRSSANLASTYGVATTGTMAITAVLFFVVARRHWKWSVWRAGALTALFLAVDLSFFGANLVKIPTGGWFPLGVAAGVYVLMSTWKRGRHNLARILQEESLPLDLFLQDITRRCPTRVPGTAVFMSSDPGGTPPVLLHHVKHNKVLHEKVVLVSVESEEIPQVPTRERVELKEMGQGFYQVIAHYGFMETPDVPLVLGSLATFGLQIQPMQTTFYLGRETLLATGRSKMARWRKRLFIIMTRNAQPASAFFGLPPNRVVEMGAQIQI
ncbi:MAG: KUP/HAK/KT family potassium transporter, partial [Gemmatimonadales bacterium]